MKLKIIEIIIQSLTAIGTIEACIIYLHLARRALKIKASS